MKKFDWKRWYREGKEKLKPMTFTQRIDHIWTYYKAIVLVVVVLAMVPVGLIVSCAGKKDVRFAGMVVNMDMRKDGVTYLTDDLSAKLGANPKKETVDVLANAFESSASEIDGNYNAAMSTIGRISAGALDYLIMDKLSMEFYILQEIYLDLREIFSQEELDAFGDKVIKITPEDDQNTQIPVAIDISDTTFAKDCLSEKAEIYLAFVGNPERTGEYRAFWEYLLAWEHTEYHEKMTQNNQ